MPEGELCQFVLEARLAARILGKATGSQRVNLALLGNTVAHVHWHLIPRFPAVEPLPQRSPWDDTRPKTELSPSERSRLIRGILAASDELTQRSP